MHSTHDAMNPSIAVEDAEDHTARTVLKTIGFIRSERSNLYKETNSSLTKYTVDGGSFCTTTYIIKYSILVYSDDDYSRYSTDYSSSYLFISTTDNRESTE